MRRIIKIQELQRALKRGGYKLKRTTGSHQIWSNGIKTVSVPVVKLNPMIAKRLVKECNLSFYLDKNE